MRTRPRSSSERSTPRRAARAPVLGLWLGLSAMAGACMPGTTRRATDGTATAGQAPDGAEAAAGRSGSAPRSRAAPRFELGPEFAGPCVRAEGPIEVNAGNAPEAFVRAAHCQIAGSEPATGVVSEWAGKLRSQSWVRRIDVVRALCDRVGRACTFSYADPWKNQVPLETRCARSSQRELGAVFMYFSHCPGEVNCAMDWANTHAPGMKTPSPLLGFGATPSGHYNPRNPGLWRRALLDARWAGLQFLLLDTFGPELSSPDQPLAALERALGDVGSDVKIALFDDPWAWGKPYFGDAWRTAPDLSHTDAAVRTLYESKWKPFFSALAREHWYAFRGRPLVYLYNAGTLTPLARSMPVVAGLKQRFRADFGVEPFVVVEDAYFQDASLFEAADGRFAWDTFRTGRLSRYVMKGTTVAHFMAKWDSIGRDAPGARASERDRVIKGPALLERRLGESADADLVTIATWNDLGEGTGIERNYDYYFAGRWLLPNAFMQLTRNAQCRPP